MYEKHSILIYLKRLVEQIEHVDRLWRSVAFTVIGSAMARLMVAVEYKQYHQHIISFNVVGPGQNSLKCIQEILLKSNYIKTLVFKISIIIDILNRKRETDFWVFEAIYWELKASCIGGCNFFFSGKSNFRDLTVIFVSCFEKYSRWQ